MSSELAPAPAAPVPAVQDGSGTFGGGLSVDEAKQYMGLRSKGKTAGLSPDEAKQYMSLRSKGRATSQVGLPNDFYSEEAKNKRAQEVMASEYQTPGVGARANNPTFADNLGEMVDPLVPNSAGSYRGEWGPDGWVPDPEGGISTGKAAARVGRKALSAAQLGLTAASGGTYAGAAAGLGTLGLFTAAPNAPVVKQVGQAFGALGEGAAWTAKQAGADEDWQDVARVGGDAASLYAGAKVAHGVIKGAREAWLESRTPKAPPRPVTPSGPTEYGMSPTKILGKGLPGIEVKSRGPITLQPSEFASPEELAQLRAEESLARHGGEVPADQSGPRANTPIEKPNIEAYGQELPGNTQGGPQKLPLTGTPVPPDPVQPEGYGQELRGNIGGPERLPLTGEPQVETPLEDRTGGYGMSESRVQGRGMRRGGRGGQQSGQAFLPEDPLGKIGEFLGKSVGQVAGKAASKVLPDFEGVGGSSTPPGGGEPSSGAPGASGGPSRSARALRTNVGATGILHELADMKSPTGAGRELSERVNRALRSGEFNQATWERQTYDPGWKNLSSGAKKFLAHQGHEAVSNLDNPEFQMPDDARAFLEGERSQAMQGAEKNLLVEDAGKLRPSNIEPRKYAPGVLTDEAKALYEAKDPATIQAWEQANPGRNYEAWLADKQKAASTTQSGTAGRYESDWLKPVNKNALPCEVNWPEQHLEQNLYMLDKSYIPRMARYQAQMEHLGVSDVGAEKYTGPRGQGRMGKLLKTLKGEGLDAERAEHLVRDAFNRSYDKPTVGSKAANLINAVRSGWFFTKNINALHHLSQGGLMAGELASRPSGFGALAQKVLSEPRPWKWYKEGVQSGVLDKMFRDNPQLQGMDFTENWSGKTKAIGRALQTAATGQYSFVQGVTKTMMYAVSENAMKSLGHDLAKTGDAAAGALHFLSDEIHMSPEQINEIRSGDVSPETLKSFQRLFVGNTTGSALPGFEASWLHRQGFIPKLAGFAQRGALATMDTTLRGPIEEAVNGRPARLLTTIAGAYTTAYALDKALSAAGVETKNKFSAKEPEQIIEDFQNGNDNAKWEVLHWLSEYTQKSWVLGSVGRRLGGAGSALAYGNQHNEKAAYIAQQMLEILIDPNADPIPRNLKTPTMLRPMMKEQTQSLPDFEAKPR